MTLSSGVIDPGELDTEFNAYLSTILNNTKHVGETFQYEIDVLDASSATAVAARTLCFIAPDDLLISYLGIQVFNQTAVSRTFTVAVRAVALDSDGQTDIGPRYFNSQTISDSTTVSAASETIALSNLTASNYRLIAGVEYELQLTAASASAADRVVGILACVSNRRRG